MNQKTLQSTNRVNQGIYKTFETEEFYRRYLMELGCREDRRKAEDQRAIRVTAKDSSVVLSCGQTIIIAHVESAIEQVTFSPVSNSYGEPLLSKTHLIKRLKSAIQMVLKEPDRAKEIKLFNTTSKKGSNGGIFRTNWQAVTCCQASSMLMYDPTYIERKHYREGFRR
jgi:hypothetical protein